jgi:uncharacterized repeat protein (TIGR03803 family)
MFYLKVLFRASVCLLLVNVIFACPAPAATYKVLHAFSSTPDGGGLFGRLALDADGNLYGATSGGGAYGLGTVFELKPLGGGHWNEIILHSFCPDYPQCSDGGAPFKGVTFDASGNLYGTVSANIFRLVNVNDEWTFNVIYDQGANGDLLTDQAGNLYLPWGLSGSCSGGEIAKLKPPRDGGNWLAKDLYDFCNDENHYWPKGQDPLYDLNWDANGNLYGVTKYGGADNHGVVFQLEHTPKGWKEHVLHSFHYLNQDADLGIWSRSHEAR